MGKTRTAAQLVNHNSGDNTGNQTTISGNAGSATALQTARNIDGQSFDGTANITVIAPGTHAASSKATPVDADEIPLVDSATSNVLKKLTWSNLKATAKTYFDTIYQAALGFTAVPTTTTINGSDLSTNRDFRPVSAEVSGSDFTTTSNSATDITGLSIAVAANKKYKVVCVLNITSATTNGMKFTMSAPAAATVQQIVIAGPAASAATPRIQRITAFGTLNTTALMTSASNSGCTITGFFSTGANAGNVKLQVAAATNGDTMTISIGSTMEISERI